MEAALDYLGKGSEEILTAIIKRFDERVKEIFNLPGFKGFRKIEIDDIDFGVHVYRTRGNKQ